MMLDVIAHFRKHPGEVPPSVRLYLLPTLNSDGLALGTRFNANGGATVSGIPEFQTFAAGIERDKPAVVAARALPFSNGQVEGQVNRLKLIKRMAYGRATCDLLRQRVRAPTG